MARKKGMSKLSAMELAELLASSVYKTPKDISEDDRITIEGENGYFDEAVTSKEDYDKYYKPILDNLDK